MTHFHLPSYFDDFLAATRPTPKQRATMLEQHSLLRERLMKDEELAGVVAATFIQGSHRRNTANRGSESHPCDVDIVVVTEFDRSARTAVEAHHAFEPFLRKHYPGAYKPQDRSWCITVAPDVKLDLVPTAKPESRLLREVVQAKAVRYWNDDDAEDIEADFARSEDWERSEPLWIPDRKLATWEQTHPLFLIGWTSRKNARCNGHFLHVVRAIKWWRRERAAIPERPKGYPLEHIIGDSCPDGITTTAEGLTRTFETIAERYRLDVLQYRVPELWVRGVSTNPANVMRRITPEDFAGFHQIVCRAAQLCRQAMNASSANEAAGLWHKFLGHPFPPAPAPTVHVSAPGFTPPRSSAKPPAAGERFG